MHCIKRVIDEKKIFAEKLSELVLLIGDPDIQAVEYKYFPDKYSELIRIRYSTLDRFINVTGDSMRSILVEVARELNGQDAVGAIRDPRHAELLEKWWTDND